MGRINPKNRLWLVTSKEPNAGALASVCIDVDGGRALAGDGRVLVAVPLENVEGLPAERLIGPLLWEQVAKRGEGEFTIADGLLRYHDDEVGDTAVELLGVSSQPEFPGVAKVEPAADLPGYGRRVRLDARRLHEVAQAMGTRLVDVWLPDDAQSFRPLVVYPAGMKTLPWAVVAQIRAPEDVEAAQKEERADGTPVLPDDYPWLPGLSPAPAARKAGQEGEDSEE